MKNIKSAGLKEWVTLFSTLGSPYLPGQLFSKLDTLACPVRSTNNNITNNNTKNDNNNNNNNNTNNSVIYSRQYL